MNRHFEYTDTDIREDLPEAYREAWEIIAQPGYWWTAEEKIAIAEESRNAIDCDFCDERAEALSPNSVKGEHNHTTELPANVIDVVHRIVRDASRLSSSWLNGLYTDEFTDAHYIELLGVVVAVISVDNFHLGLGMPLEPLPNPNPGTPSNRRPAGAKSHGAWVPMVMPADLEAIDNDMYDGMPDTGNVMAAMSLVPDSVKLLMILGGAQYLEARDVPNPSTNGGRALSRSQIEFVAGRVSAHNQCFY